MKGRGARSVYSTFAVVRIRTQEITESRRVLYKMSLLPEVLNENGDLCPVAKQFVCKRAKNNSKIPFFKIPKIQFFSIKIR